MRVQFIKKNEKDIFHYNDNLKIIPRINEKIKINEDGKVYKVLDIIHHLGFNIDILVEEV
jgi:hypothetical protein